MSQKPARKKLSRRSRLLLALFLGSGSGLICSYLPEQYQGPCSLLARVLGVLFGSP